MLRVGDTSIQLVNYNKQEKIYTFNKEALQQIIEENGVQDLPVSVISVAGLFRKGKSFLLNLFLRYLYAEDRQNWLNDSNEPLKGFEWRGGRKLNTEGIHIWSKIFTLQIADGSQVAVMLMDTQGTFDGKSKNKTDTAIFALSALVSSVQVYNLSQQISEDDLENLLWFTQNASSVQGETEQKAFQSLIFLVRDWHHFIDYPYGEKGGKKLLDQVLQITPDQEPSLTKVRNDLRSTFEKLSCFLLPYPGKTVATDMNFNGNIKDIDDEFITHIRAFVTSVLSPGNLVKKNVYGLELKCPALVKIFATCLKYYNSNEFPDEVSKAEAAAEAYYAPLVERCANVYKMEMMKMLDDYQDRIENCTSQVFAEAHEEMLRMAINSFNKAKRINKGVASSKTELLIKEIQELFESLNKRRSGMYRFSAAKHYNVLASEIENEYNNKMIAILNKNEDEIELYTPTAYAEKHEKYKTMAIDMFRKHKRFIEYDTTECLEKLKQDIDDSYGINEIRRKSKFESTIRSYYNHFLETCLGEYNTKMCKLIDEPQLEKASFERVHEKYKSISINEFNEAKCYSEDIQSNYLEKLKQHIETSFMSYEKQRIHMMKYENEKLKYETNVKITMEERKYELEQRQMNLEFEKRKFETELVSRENERKLEFETIKVDVNQRILEEKIANQIKEKELRLEAEHQLHKELHLSEIQKIRLKTEADQRQLENKLQHHKQTNNQKKEESIYRREILKIKTEEKARIEELELTMEEKILKFELEKQRLERNRVRKIFDKVFVATKIIATTAAEMAKHGFPAGVASVFKSRATVVTVIPTEFETEANATRTGNYEEKASSSQENN